MRVRARRYLINPLLALVGILAVIWIVGYGFDAFRLARDRRRSPARWLVYGAVLGPLGIRILRLAPPGCCNTCLNPVRGWSIWCSYCGCDARENWDMPGVAWRAGPEAGPARLAVIGRPEGDPTAIPTASQAAGPAARASSSRTAGAGRSTAAAASPKARTSAGRRSSPSQARKPAGSRSPTTQPRRPVARKPTVSSAETTGQERPRYMASAVFVEGSEPLERGARYELAVDGDDLRITGRARSLPGGRVLSRRLREVQMTSTAERLVIAGTSERLAAFHLVFDSVRNEARDHPGELVARSPTQDVDPSVATR